MALADYNPGMNTTEILQAIDAEIDRLAKAPALLTDHTPPLKRGVAKGSDAPTRKRRKMSPEGQARIAAAQKARWAKAKRS
jgi:hypothetical protein